jgi:hypothetical protein
MARPRRDYTGEKLTAFVGFQLTPSERAKLEAAAKEAGGTISQHARELCLRRSGETRTVAGTRRHPVTHELVSELSAIGNNVNQLSKHCNTAETAPQLQELQETMGILKAALAKVLAL